MTAYRCGFVALAGRPNVGKSTLLNALVGEHLSIVSPKAQTTREQVSGILTGRDFQIIFTDAPGLLEPHYALQAAMRWAADRAIEDADVVALIGDATRPDTLPDAALLEALRAQGTPSLVVINKIDRVDAAERARLVSALPEEARRPLEVSARSGAGLEELLETLVALLPPSPPHFPEEYTATQPVRFFAEEYVREACLALFHEEVPYSIVCRVEEFRESQDPVYIRMTVYVERESQKGIVIGRGGRTIRRLGRISRRKIEELVDRQVYLDLRVKVMAGWSRKRSRLEHLGFRLPPAGEE